jgi:hypothetical protein
MLLVAMLPSDKLNATGSVGSVTFASTRAQVDLPTYRTWLAILYRSREPTSLTLQSTQGQLSARLGEKTVISAMPADRRGALVDEPVAFGASSGQVMPPSARTNASGVATTTLQLDDVAIHTINRITYPLTVTATSGLISGTLSVTLVPLPCDDRNVGPALDTGRVSLNAACVGSFTPDQVKSDTDQRHDWYRLDATTNGTIHVTLRGIPAGADYDLGFFSRVGNVFSRLASSSQGGNADEELRSPVVAGSLYYVEVALSTASETQNTYILAVSMDETPPAPSCTSSQGLRTRNSSPRFHSLHVIPGGGGTLTRDRQHLDCSFMFVPASAMRDAAPSVRTQHTSNLRS